MPPNPPNPHMNSKRFARLLVSVFFASTVHSQQLATPTDPFAKDFVQPETPTHLRQIRVELETFTIPVIDAHALGCADGKSAPTLGMRVNLRLQPILGLDFKLPQGGKRR